MKFGIIAAGHGSRLAAAGAGRPKPLLDLGGQPMIQRLARLFLDCGAGRVAVSVNPNQPDTVSFMQDMASSLPLDIVVTDPPTPMHSLLALKPYLQGHPFCVTTVDTVFSSGSLDLLLESFRQELGRDDNSGVMGVTEFADDEKPLYIKTGDDMSIQAFLDERADCRYVSAGVYALPASALDILEKAVADGESRMRHFQRRLLSDGMALKACNMGRVIDVDRIEDLALANDFVGSL